MAERVSHLLLLLALLLACNSPKTESHISVPTTLKAVEALHAPPDVVVEVKRKERSAGGGSCGHSPLCILVLPILVANSVFPTKWDEATVTTHGKTSYQANFTTHGEFIDSTETGPARVSNYGALALKQLKKRVIVKLSEADVDPGGNVGEPRGVKILPQVDLIADYEAALAKESDAEDRVKLMSEAVSWLGDESLPFLAKHLSDAGEPDKTRGGVLNALCRASEDKSGILKPALDAAVKQPTPEVARAGANCAVSRSDVALRGEFSRALAEQLCGTSDDALADAHLKVLSSLPSNLAWGQVSGVVSRCSEPSARMTLLHVFNQPLDAAALTKVVSGDAPHAQRLLLRLDPERPAERGAVFDGLTAHPETTQLIRRVAGGDTKLTAGELVVLAKSYVLDGFGLDARRRAHILTAFHKASRAKLDIKAALSVIQSSVNKAAEDDRPTLRVALLALGDHAQAMPASRGLTHADGWPEGADDVLDTDDLLRFGLKLAGCDREGVRKAYAGSSKLSDSSRGALCTH